MGEPAAVKSSGSTTPAGIDSPRPPSPSAQLVGTESSFVALAAVEEAVSPKQKSPVDKAAVTAQAQAAVAAAVAAAAAIEIAIEPSTESSTGPASQNGTSGTSTPAAPGPETRRVGNGPAEGSPATHPTTHQRSQNQHWHEHHERHQERPLQQPNSATKHFV
ncbi:hypothetical protein DCS_02385 [Drechmeria coniospora]|uniref:Uncharacterized protein n=1 Tax=Drechmeria coniospora TaxID=98403 RepID=A0A151GW19_DRECN|nr:hypothetical protein DCS_02385 [Drechmeria coniospora]KYK61243.1 hypothetical protein DCS_02385 [Drechmeria coniospora]